MTIGFWVNATDWDGGDVPSPTLFNIDGTLWWEANWMGDNALNLKLLGAGDVGTIGNLPPEGEWHYLAFTYDGTTLTTFFDGEPTSTYPYAAGLPYSNLQFGCWSTLYYRFKGLQDEASLWDRALTRGEVAHAFQIGPFVTGNSAPGTCGDSDGDGLLDQDELLIHGTDPALADTDGDGLEDGEELDLGLDPTRADTDGDGVDDGTELAWGTDPLNPDTDGDGIEDGAEGATDSDGDGIIDALDDTDDTPDPATTDTEGSPDSTSKRSADDTGCGCATAKPAPAWIGLAIALLGLRRRRSPRCASSRLHLDGQRTRQPHAGAVIPQVHATAISRRAT
jgi:MYXO-CTERM domain-containing protein